MQVFDNLNNWREEYKNMVKDIHPDICSEAGCNEAIIKLNEFKSQIENGTPFSDGIATGRYFIDNCFYEIDLKLLDINRGNYLRLVNLKDESSKHFQKYLPSNFDTRYDSKTILHYPQRAIPLSNYLNVEIKHVNWILSRLLEFACWLNQNKFCHAGINPDSIFLVPENHGIICTSFFHMKMLDERLTSITGKYLNFYPSSVTKDKIANSSIDITLCKKTAIYLLGDHSGNGAKLRGIINEEYLDFLQRVDYDPLECYTTFRNLINKYFNTKEFHELKI